MERIKILENDLLSEKQGLLKQFEELKKELIGTIQYGNYKKILELPDTIVYGRIQQTVKQINEIDIKLRVVNYIMIDDK
jgi:hypothetical protein